jgi:hypothetical protein
MEKHVDGHLFDTPEISPTRLQISLARRYIEEDAFFTALII